MDNIDVSAFGELLSALRKRHKISQQELAKKLDLHRNTISQWERGICLPDSKTIVLELGRQLGLDTHDTRSLLETSLTTIAPYWYIPYRRNPFFTGRENVLQQLYDAFGTERSATFSQSYALSGLGGIGKTQIAVEYAYRAREQCQYIYTFWINAASKEALMTSFTALTDVLPTFPAKNETNQQRLVAAIKRWLEQRQERWLLIFDNADDLSLVQEYIPHSGNGSILLTTRANAVGSLAVSIRIDKMGFVEGTHLLLRRAQRLTQASDEEINEAGNIVVALDHFPLALEQAGAYIEETSCSFRNYLQLYQTHRSTLLARRGIQNTNYPESVATTWSLSFHKVEQDNPAAAELLQLCTFLAPDHIPEELLTEGTPYWPPMLQGATADLFAFDQMLEALLAFSLIKRLEGNHLLSIHRLVQIVQLDRIDSEEQRQWAERVILAVNAVFPHDSKNEIATWTLCLRYLEQSQTCDVLIQQWKLMLPEGADLLDRTGRYLYEHGSFAIAEPLYQRALRIFEQSLGPEHLNLTSPLNHLAVLYKDQGKYTEAEPLFQRALHIWEQSLGPEHLNATSPLNNLADLYREQGKYIEAEPLYQRALRIWEQNPGPEHPQVAYALNGLADLYREQGKYTEAESLYQRALQIREHALEPDHSDIADNLYGFAILREAQGRSEEAVPLYHRTLAILEKVYGTQHIKTIKVHERLQAVTIVLAKRKEEHH